MQKIIVEDVVRVLHSWAPAVLAESWDNVGLIVGHSSRPVQQIMTCLTLTPDVADEAISKGADLVVSHHPLLFRPVQQLTSNSDEGELLLKLIEGGVAVYSPHTSYDSAFDGINQQLAELFGLKSVQPLREIQLDEDELKDFDGDGDTDDLIGSGRWGHLAEAISLKQLLATIKQKLNVENLQFVGSVDNTVQRVGIACGSAAEFMTDAKRKRCDVLVTGEARFHACLEARSLGINLVLAGHYATERPAMQVLADRLASYFPQVDVWASSVESDPLQWDC